MSNFSDMEVLILAGGKGTRVSNISNLPKVLIRVNDVPLISYSINCARRRGLSNFLFKLGHQSKLIIEYLEDIKLESEIFNYYIEDVLEGTCGGLNFLKERENPLLVMYGDVINNINLKDFYDFHVNNKSQASLVVHSSDHPEDSDVVVLSENKGILKIINKPQSNSFGNITNAAMYIINPECFNDIPLYGKFDFARDLFPKLIHNSYKILGYETEEFIRDVGTESRLNQIEEIILLLEKNNSVDCVFLDRDGTLIEEKDLLINKEEVSIIPGSSEGIRLLNDKNIVVIVISNQSVVARNLCSVSDVIGVNDKIGRDIYQLNKAYIDDFLFCPHHPDSGYPEENKEFKIICDCRKPKTGLIEMVSRLRNINLSKSYFIGDTTTDIETASRAGIKSILVKTGYSGKDSKYTSRPDYIAEDLYQAAKMLTGDLL